MIGRYCLVDTTNQMDNQDTKPLHSKQRSTPRTLRRCNDMAHHRDMSQLDPFETFTCRGCNTTFTSREQLNNSVPKSETERKRMQDTHQGQRYHAPPLFQQITEPIRWITCILHVVLRLVDGLFAWTVKRCVKTTQQEDKMNSVLTKMGIHVKKLKKTKEEIHKKAMKETKFHGRDCKKILTKQLPRAQMELTGYKAIIDAMEYDDEGWMTKEKAMKLWDALSNLIEELEDEWDTPESMYDHSDEAPDVRKKRGEKAKKLAGDYLDLFTKHIGSDNVTLYLHVCYHHVPTMIEKVGSLSR